MPRNGSGTSTVVNTFVIDTIADPDEVNANFTDVADQLTNSLPRDGQAGMNAPLPLQNGTASLPALTFTSDPDTGFYRSGANKIGLALGGSGYPLDAGVVYTEKSTDYTALATDNNAVLRFTAAATLSLTAAATLATNWHVTVIADGGDVTIDPDASETIDGATTLVVPNGSAARIICNGSAFFTEKTNAPLQPFATVASATTTDIGAATSQNVTVTGTTTITSFGTVAAGTFRRLRFSGILTLTHNATSLILPNSGSNITTAAGDTLEAVSLGSGNWVVTSYQYAAGQMVIGTFTPGFAFGGGSTGIAYSLQTGTYQKIGKTVWFSIRVTLSNAGSSTGALTITGLPFTASTVDAAVSVGYAAFFSGLAGAISGFVLSSTSTISLRQNSASGYNTNVTQANCTNAVDIIISGHYEIV